MKFNFVLIPNLESVSNAMINLAKEASLNLEPNYLLKAATELSIPHISVVQFSLEDSKKVDLTLIWEYAMSIWHELIEEEYQCHLSSKINYKYDAEGPFAGVSWAEILVNKFSAPWLQVFHDKLRMKLEPLGIKCLNAHGKRWNPHFTLFNAQKNLLPMQSNLLQKIPENYIRELESFSVRPALGYANDQWELINFQHSMDPVKKSKFRL